MEHSDKTKDTEQGGSRAEPSSHHTVPHTPYHSKSDQWLPGPAPLYIPGALQPSSCSHSHFPAEQPCSQQHPRALQSSTPFPSHPALSWGLCPQLLPGVTSRRRAAAAAACAYVQRDTAAPLLHTHSQHPMGAHKNELLGPWVRQGNSHSQDKFSHFLQSHLFKDLWAHSRGDTACT